MDHNFTTWALSELFCPLMVFARLGGFLHLMPGLSEPYVFQRFRLAWALALAALISPVVQKYCPPLPQNALHFSALLVQEVVIGLIAGIVLKTVLSTLELVGSLYGYQTGLANTFTLGPATSQQVGLPSAFLGAVVLALVFVLDFHHLFLQALVKSYERFPPMHLPPLTDFSGLLARVAVKTLSASFMMALQMGAPILILGVVTLLISGLLGRLVPQIQIFFVLQPFQIWGGIFILMVSLSLMIRQFFDFFNQILIQLWGATLTEIGYG